MIFMDVVQLYEILKKYLAKDYLVWLSVEEARQWGLNMIYYTLAVEPILNFGVIAFEYYAALEQVIPIATLLGIPSKESITMDKLRSIKNYCEVFVAGTADETMLLIPIDEENIRQVIEVCIPKVVEIVSGQTIEPIIDGYYLDLLVY